MDIPTRSSPCTWSIGQISQNLENGIKGPEAPVLRVDVTGIRDRKAIYRKSITHEEPPSKRTKTTSVHAQCLLTIWASNSGKKEDPAYLVKQSQSCVVVAWTRESGERVATVTMKSPFFVKYEELLIEGRNTLNTYSTQSHDMQLCLLPANATDPWPPMDFLSPPPRLPQKMDHDGLVRFPMLLAQWRKLPQLPESGSDSLLEAMAYQDTKRYKTKLSLKMEANWSAPSSSLLSYNAKLRDKLSPSPHLPSPVSEEESPAPKVSVTWVFAGPWDHLDPIEFDGYLCPLCSERKFANMDAYHFHLITSHDLFQFELSVRATTSENRQQKIEVDVVVDVIDTFGVKAGNNVRDEREMNWQSPRTLFDLEVFLKGNESWVGKENRKVRNLVPPRPKLDDMRSRSGDSVLHEVPISAPFRAAEHVPNIPVPDRKKFRVPAAPPDTNFFRLTVKRPLKEGEYVSESDDDMDQSWLLQKHNDTIESFCDMSQSEKQFIQRYDSHMLDENLSSNLHFREALVRFCRVNKEWLRRKGMRAEFHKNAARLFMQGSISAKLLRECIKIMGNQEKSESKVEIMDSSEDESQTSPLARVPLNRSLHNKASPETLQKISRGQSHSPTDASHNFGRCKCGSAIRNMHTGIRCSNLNCHFPDYHLRCAGAVRRIPGWLCRTCEKSSIPSVTNSRHDSSRSTIPIETENPASPARPTSPATRPRDHPMTEVESSTGQPAVKHVLDPSAGPSPYRFASPAFSPPSTVPRYHTSATTTKPSETQQERTQRRTQKSLPTDVLSLHSSDLSEDNSEPSSDDVYADTDEDFTDEEQDLVPSAKVDMLEEDLDVDVAMDEGP
ncbi:hypothetical protein MMC13_003643 [Lambiella insularis]|nr:hypothetical protein [Lambiella insularis]